MLPDCLNLSHPSIRPYVAAYGIAGTYRIYAQHDYWLPDFAAYQQQKEADVLPTRQALALLQERIDQGQFKVADIGQLGDGIPEGTSAAFVADTLYFGRQISRGDVLEEAFHAIFSRLVSREEKEQLLETGKYLLKASLKQKGFSSVESYYAHMQRIAPQIYGRLDEQQGYARLYEEALAQAYVRYTTYGKTKEKPYRVDLTDRLTPYLGKKVATHVDRLVNGLFSLINKIKRLYEDNRMEADLFFDKINRGEYQTARIIESDDYQTVPSTRQIELADGTDMSVGESQQLIRNMGALVIALRDQPDLMLARPGEHMQVAMESMAALYRQEGKDKIAAVLEPTRFDLDTFEDVPNEEYLKIQADLLEHLKTNEAMDGLIGEEEEDQIQQSDSATWDKEAWQTGGYDTLNSRIKQYIATTGTPRLKNGEPVFHSIAVPGYKDPVTGVETGILKIPVIDIVHPDRVYYGAVRAVSNTVDLRKRFEKLLVFTQLDGNPAVRAFTDRLVKDLAPATYVPSPAFAELTEQYGLNPDLVDTPMLFRQALIDTHRNMTPETVKRIASSAFLRQKSGDVNGLRTLMLDHLRKGTLDSYLSESGTDLLIWMMKGLDLWSRTFANMRVDPANRLSVTSNANQNRGAKNLTLSWKTAYENLQADKAPLKTEGASLNLSYRTSKQTQHQFDRLPQTEQSAALTAALDRQSRVIGQVFARLGVTLPPSYIRYCSFMSLLEQQPALRSKLEQLPTFALTQLFQIPPAYRLTVERLEEAIKYATQKQHSPWERTNAKGFGGMVTILDRIAEGAVQFDESAVETSFVNADGESVFGFQKKTFSLDFQSWFTELGLPTLKRLYETGQRTLLRQEDGKPVYLMEDSWTLTQNRLLRELLYNPVYQANGHLLRGITTDGLSQTSLRRDPKAQATLSVEGAVPGEGSTFGDLTPREFELFHLNGLTSAGEWTQTVRVDPNNPKDLRTVRINPVFLGNRETSKTGEFLLLPMLEGLTTGDQLTEYGANLMLDEIEKEYTRIMRVGGDLTYVDQEVTDEKGLATTNLPVFATGHYLGDNRVEKYHTGSKLRKIQVADSEGNFFTVHVPTSPNDYRGLQFSDATIGLLGARQQLPTSYDPDNLVIQALSKKPFDRTAVMADLQREVSSILRDHEKRYADHGIIFGGVDQKGKKIKSKLVDREITYQLAMDKLVSDWLNGIAVAQLSTGDGAMLHKNDGIDTFKRLKALNAAGQSFAVPLAAPALGIPQAVTHLKCVTHAEITAQSDVSGDSIQLADAQGYGSLQSFREAFFGQGKLTPRLARLLDMVDSGEPFSWQLQEALADEGVMLNSMKTVGADGQQYKKLSVTPLTKLVTSRPVMISKEDFDTHAKIDSWGRTQVNPGAPEVSSWIDLKSGERVYAGWVARTDTAPLHEKRMILEGYRYDGNQWVYKGQGYKVGLITPLSGSKTLNVNVHNDVTGQDVNWTSLNESSVHLLSYDHYKLQTENPSGKTEITDPSQMLALISNELGEKAQIWFKDQFINKDMTETLWQGYLTGRTTVNFNLANQLFKDEAGEFSVKPFIQKAYESILKTGGDKQLVALAKPDSGFNMNIPLTRDKFISQFFSHFSKGVLAHKRAGDALAHVSSAGHQLIKRVFINDAGFLDWEVVRRDSDQYILLQKVKLPSLQAARYKHTFTTNEGVKTLQEPDTYLDEDGKPVDSWFTQARNLLQDAGGKEVYILDSLRHNKPRWEQQGENLIRTGFFSESLMPAWHKNITDISTSLRYAFGVRIPSQDKHSAMNIEWVDTLPHYLGSSIVVPKEMVELSGGDFDIDKLYLTRNEGYWQKHEDGSKEFVAYSANTYTDYVRYMLSSSSMISKAITKGLAKDTVYQEASNRLIKLLDEKKEAFGLKKKTTNTITEIKSQLMALEGYTRWTTPADVLEAINLDRESLREDRDIEYHVKEYLEGEIEKLAGQITDLVSIRNERAERVREDVFDHYRLPPTETAFEEHPHKDRLNVGIVQNNMLALQNSMLNNDVTLDDDDPVGGQANQPASLTAMQNLKKVKHNDELVFTQDKKRYSIHWPIRHSEVHEGNGIGKSNIGISVNGTAFLVEAVRLGFEVNEDHLIAYQDDQLHDGQYRAYMIDAVGERVKGTNGKPIRTFDTVSTITTANTDEAKEGLNAYFNLTTEAQNILIHLLGLGYSFDNGMRFVNQPVVVRYLMIKDVLKRVRTRKGIITEAEEGLVRLSAADISRRALGMERGVKFPETRVYTPAELADSIQRGKQNKEVNLTLQASVLEDFIKMQAVAGDAANLLPFIKLNKGFGQDIPSFTRLETAADRMGLGKTEYSPVIDIATKMLAQPKAAAQLLQFIRHIVPASKQLQEKVLLRQHPEFVHLVDKLLTVFKPRGADQIEQIQRAVETYILTQLQQTVYAEARDTAFADQPGPDLNLVYPDEGRPTSLATKLALFKKEYGSTIFAGNPLMTWLQINRNTGNVSLNSLIRTQAEQQEGLLDGFRELITRPDQPLDPDTGKPVGQTMAFALFNYFIAKSGWQYTKGNISKLFSPEIFAPVSALLTEFQEGGVELGAGSVEDLMTSMGRDMNYTQLLPKMNEVSNAKHPQYKKLKQFNVLQYVDGEGDLTQTQSQEVRLIFPKIKGITGNDELDELARSMGVQLDTESKSQQLVFPRFMRFTSKEIDPEDPDGESMVTLEHAYELLESDSHAARYVRIVPSGTPGVSGATGLGEYYTASAVSQLNRIIEESTEEVKAYYEERRDNRINLGVNFEQETEEEVDMEDADVSDMPDFSDSFEETYAEEGPVVTAQPVMAQTITMTKGSKKVVYTAYDREGKQASKTGYQITIDQYPNLEVYLTDEAFTQDSDVGKPENNYKMDGYSLDMTWNGKTYMISERLEKSQKAAIQAAAERLTKTLSTEEGQQQMARFGFVQNNPPADDIKNHPNC